jgi:hypothetical protein
MERIEISRVMPAAAGEVRPQFWDIAAWQRVWDRITTVDVLYDDGVHQEIEMTVERDGALERVRTARLSVGGDIEFFSPLPPPTMSVHHGAWRFADVPGGCLVTAQRDYRLLLSPGEPGPARNTRQLVYRAAFQRRLTAILDSFVAYFDPSRSAA